MDLYFLITLFAVVCFCIIVVLTVYCVKICKRYSNNVRNSDNTRVPHFRETANSNRCSSHQLLSRAYNSDSYNTPLTMPFPSTRTPPTQQINANNPYPPPSLYTPHAVNYFAPTNNLQNLVDVDDLPPSYEVATGQQHNTRNVLT
ncbi:hypothetical protein RI129_003877 [Pyrocoelia pectoralis]|uniref:Uncharacterized protein n=1 Tax=Pyrocoelia pectoralis TaxID=417401 RepID=A0AAN7VHM1_9COLE